MFLVSTALFMLIRFLHIGVSHSFCFTPSHLIAPTPSPLFFLSLFYPLFPSPIRLFHTLSFAPHPLLPLILFSFLSSIPFLPPLLTPSSPLHLSLTPSFPSLHHSLIHLTPSTSLPPPPPSLPPPVGVYYGRA